jgi:undecaprenyl-diphosphatase
MVVTIRRRSKPVYEQRLLHYRSYRRRRRHPEACWPLVAASRRVWQWVSDRAEKEALILVGLLGAVVFVWLFVELADEVLEGERLQLDEHILRSFRQPGDLAQPIGPPWLRTAALDLTALGGTTIVALVNVVALGYLGLRKKWNSFWLMAASVCGGAISNLLLKDLFGRARPTVVPHLAEVDSMSFPSGHSMLAAITYLTLGAMLARAAEGSREKVYIITLSIVMTLIIGLTRVYLGVHYPSDVLAGWCAGIAWAIVCLLGAKLLERFGVVKKRPVLSHGPTER